MHSPRVSVGIPVYNAEAFLAQTIESMLGQDYNDLEIVISDNASTDGTEAICRRYAALDARVRYYRSDINRGATWNFNEVFRRSRGEYYKWQAYDDLCLPTFISSCMREFDRGPASLVLVYPRSATIDENGRPQPQFVERSIASCDSRPERRLAMVLQNLTMASQFYGLIRASELRKTRLLGSFVAADYVLLAEMAVLGELREVPDILFLRRVHPRISTYANRSAAELLQWFDPSRRRNRVWVAPWIWVGFEYVRSIRLLPLRTRDRWRCYTTAIGVWYWGLLRNFIGKHRRKLRRGWARDIAS